MKYHTYKIRLIGRIDPIEVQGISYEGAIADVMEAYANVEIQQIQRVG